MTRGGEPRGGERTLLNNGRSHTLRIHLRLGNASRLRARRTGTRVDTRLLRRMSLRGILRPVDENVSVRRGGGYLGDCGVQAVVEGTRVRMIKTEHYPYQP